MRRARGILSLLLLGAAGSVFPTACDSGSTTTLDAALQPQVQEQGQLQLSLIGVSNTGTSYRLREAIIVVQGPDSTLFLDSDLEPESTSLGASVPVGLYTAFLQEGWILERVSGTGKGQALSASLLSANPVSFLVGAGQNTRVPLRFAVGEETIDIGSFDIVLEVQEQAQPEAAICNTTADCAAGQTCCPGGFLGTCQALAPGASCVLPDLTVDANVARASLFTNSENFPPGSCALEEGCVDGSGERRLLRFSTQTGNIGGSDIVLGDPGGTEGFEFAACHGHYHFEGYAEYQLLDATGAVTARGHKQAFCLLDSNPVLPNAPPNPRFHCGFQGIQRGWSDVYGSNLDCQWVDITDVPPGDYTLRIRINPERVIEESNYDNNTAEIPVTITADDTPAGCRQLGAIRECGWAINEKMRGLSCRPGAILSLGCGCSAGGVCQGDPMLRVCEGTEECSVATAIARGDDACGACPEVAFSCPPSGVYTVLTGSFDPALPSVCQPVATAIGPFGLLEECPLLGPDRDCGWSVNEAFSKLGCAPGQTTTIGCGGCTTGAGSCQGDPMLRVCAGDEPCTAANALVSNDDSCSVCSEATFTCPSDGTVTVLTGSYNGLPISCEPTVTAPPVVPPAVPPSPPSPPTLPPTPAPVPPPASVDAGAP